MSRFAIAIVCVLSALALTAAAAPAAGPGWRVWICLPGRDDSCSLEPTITVVTPMGTREVERVLRTSRPVDCFYVYPTVSPQMRGNSTLAIQWPEAGTTITQASQFSRVCRVYAPLYRQVTEYAGTCPYGSLACVPQGSSALAYHDVLAAWDDYLAHDNHGRGVVLIGHSQGAFVLEKLLEQQIERSAAERRLLVSAILLGGDVTVRDGSSEGGTFAHVPACASATETGCVVAYSTWGSTPPRDASLQDAPSGEHVLCVNPAAPGSAGTEAITPLFPNFASEGITPSHSAYSSIVWYTFPSLYSARCVEQGSRAWLLVTRIRHPHDMRPTVRPVLGAALGLHAADVNIALADLLALVADESRTWLEHH